MQLCTTIKSRREKLKITEVRLAAAANLTEKEIKDFEQGISIPPLNKLVIIAKMLRVSLNWLLDKWGFKKEGCDFLKL